MVATLSTPAALGMVFAVTVLAYLLRACLIVLLSEVGVPAWFERNLAYVGPAALASLAMNFAFGSGGGPKITWPEVVTLIVALAVTLWKRNFLLVLIVSMPVLWVTSTLL